MTASKERKHTLQLLLTVLSNADPSGKDPVFFFKGNIEEKMWWLIREIEKSEGRKMFEWIEVLS